MPTVERLTAAQEEVLGGALVALRRELVDAIAASETAAQPVDLDQPIGRVSRIDALQQQSMVQATRAAARRRLEQVDAALRRHEDGEYGACLSCEEPVGFARLEARPETPFCIGCQSRREAGRGDR